VKFWNVFYSKVIIGFDKTNSEINWGEKGNKTDEILPEQVSEQIKQGKTLSIIDVV
jgi:hypothetical protein